MRAPLQRTAERGPRLTASDLCSNYHCLYKNGKGATANGVCATLNESDDVLRQAAKNSNTSLAIRLRQRTILELTMYTGADVAYVTG
jgi:hypothetical protein